MFCFALPVDAMAMMFDGIFEFMPGRFVALDTDRRFFHFLKDGRIVLLQSEDPSRETEKSENGFIWQARVYVLRSSHPEAN